MNNDAVRLGGESRCSGEPSAAGKGSCVFPVSSFRQQISHLSADWSTCLPADNNVVDYLLKPVDEEELAAALKKAVSLLPPQPEEAQTADDIADNLKKYIDEHYREEISLEFLAEQFHFSREYIGRIFRAKHGFAVYEYILQVRMKQAVELLRNPKLTLPVIADFLGYSNANYFSKAFRRFYGISPSDYRNQNFRQ